MGDLDIYLIDEDDIEEQPESEPVDIPLPKDSELDCVDFMKNPEPLPENIEHGYWEE